MPRIPAAPPKPTHWQACLLASTGGAADFYTLATIPEVDEQKKNLDASHIQTTYVLRFHGDTMDVIEEVPNRLEDLISVFKGGQRGMVAAGFPTAVFEVGPAGCVEHPIANVRGSFKALWGSDEHLFACGGFAPFVLYRQGGTWFELPIPTGCPHLWGICGYHERDVYFVGDKGWVLHFDGTHLTRVETPTTNNLTKAAVLNDEHICITGYGGVLLMGNRKGFRIVPTHTHEEPLNAIAPFQGAVYYPSLDGIWRFDGTGRPTLAHPQACRWMSVLDDALLVSAAEYAWLFDGSDVEELDTYV